MKHDAALHIAVIGCGPRGLAAIESLLQVIALARRDLPFTITVFEPNTAPGAGPNYSPEQSDLNLLNIPCRDLTLVGRPTIQLPSCCIAAFPSFDQWMKIKRSAAVDPDEFPPRRLLGDYLHDRFNTLVSTLVPNGILTLVAKVVTDIKVEQETFAVHADQECCGSFKEVLVTVGHQPLQLDKQLERWKHHGDSDADTRLWVDPYPTRYLSQSSAITSLSTVALRGFGLTMIDVARALSEGRGGRFTAGETGRLVYDRSGNEPRSIVPFSLNGLPLAAKPATSDIDAGFEPDSTARSALLATLQSLITDSPDCVVDALQREFRQLVINVWRQQHRITTRSERSLDSCLSNWLAGKSTDSPYFLPEQLSPAQTMEAYLDMALAKQLPSLEYCAGQVWRHIQADIYDVFSHSLVGVTVMQDVIELDEVMKRFSYGPPVDQIMRMLALVDDGLLRFEVVDDPDIHLLPTGWLLTDKPDEVIATVMINTVIPSPILRHVASPLISNLLKANLLICYADELGASTGPSGLSSGITNGRYPSLSLLGRLATGSVIGPDSIHDCFSDHARHWAEAVHCRVTQSFDSSAP